MYQSYLVFCLVVLTLTACGSQDLENLKSSLSQNDKETQSAFDDLLTQGPITTRDIGTTNLTVGFNLNGKIIEPSIHDQRDGIIPFDPNQMPQVNESNLLEHIENVLLETGVLNGFDFKDLKPSLRHFTSLNNKLLSINFDRTHNDLIVKDAFIEVLLSKDKNNNFKIYQIHDHSFGAISIENQPSQNDLLGKLANKLKRDLRENSRNKKIIPIDENGAIKFYLANEYKTVDKNSLQDITIAIAHGSEKLLYAYEDKYSNTVVKAEVYERTYMDGKKVLYPIPLAEVNLNGTNSNLDTDGEISIDANGSARITLKSSRINTSNSGQGVFSFDQNLSQGEDSIISTDGDKLAALNAYTAIHRVNKFVRRFVNDDEVKLLNKPVNLSFNTRGSCNAFYQSGSDVISLYAKGGGCASMALVNDVIYHEWGHGLDQYTGRRGGITDGAFSEGIGDILASYMTGSPNMGMGFNEGRETGIRNVKNNKMYPRDRGGGVHSEGLIIGGAFWDLREKFTQRYGQKKGADIAGELFIRHLLTTDAYTESYQKVLALDDDDANPNTRSPNHCLITEAFANHGLATEANCQDPLVQAEEINVDESLVLAPHENNPQGWMAGSSKIQIEKVLICNDAINSCLKKNIDQLETLKFVGTKNGKRIFANENSQVRFDNLNSNSKLTLLGLDSTNKVIHKREVRVGSK